MSNLLFPFAADLRFRHVETENGRSSYQVDGAPRVEIVAPCTGYVGMYRDGTRWRLVFFTQDHGQVPIVADWIAPLTTGFYLTTNHLDADSSPREAVAFRILEHHVRTRGRRMVTVNVEEGGRYRPGATFTISETDHPTDEQLQTAARDFVSSYWPGTTTLVVPVARGTPLYVTEGSGLATTATMGMFHARRDADAQLAQWWFWFDSHEYYQRLRDQDLLERTLGLPYDTRRSAEVAASALAHPFPVYCTAGFSDVAGSRMNLMGGLQNLVISLPVESPPPLDGIDLRVPPELFYGFPRYAEGSDALSETDPIVSAVLTASGERATWRLEISPTDVRDLASGESRADIDVRWQDTGFDDDATTWLPRELSLLGDRSGATTSDPDRRDIRIRFHVHGDLNGQIRQVVRRVLAGKVRLLELLEERAWPQGPTLQEAVVMLTQLYNFSELEALPPDLRTQIRERALGSDRAREVIARFTDVRTRFNRYVTEHGSSLRLNVFERPYFSQQLRARADVDGLDTLTQVMLALEGTDAGERMLADYARPFVNNAIGDTAAPTPNYITFSVLAIFWRLGRHVHKAHGYITKFFVQRYIVETVRHLTPGSRWTIEAHESLEGNLRRFFARLDLDLERVSSVPESRATLGGGRAVDRIVYDLNYRNSARPGAPAPPQTGDPTAAFRRGTPPSLNALAACLTVLDILAKVDRFEQATDPIDRAMSLVDLAAAIAKFIAEQRAAIAGVRGLETASVLRVLGRRVARIHFLGCIQAAASAVRAFFQGLRASETPGYVDDVVAWSSVAAYTAIAVGEGILGAVALGWLGAGAGPIGWILIAAGTVILVAVGVLALPDSLARPALDPASNLALLTEALNSTDFPLRPGALNNDEHQISAFDAGTGEDGIDIHVPFVVTTRLSTARQISLLRSFLCPIYASGRIAVASGDEVTLEIRAANLELGTRIAVSLYAPSPTIDEARRQTFRHRVSFVVTGTTGSAANYEFRISSRALTLSLRRLPADELAIINRAEIVLSLVPLGPDDLADPSDRFFVDQYPETTRRVVMLERA